TDHATVASKQESVPFTKDRRKSHGKASEVFESKSKYTSSSRAAEESHSTIARTIHLFISKATWHMLENDGQPLCDMTLRWASLKAVTTSDQATHLLSEVHLLYIINRLPNPTFTDLVGPYVAPGYENLDFRIEKMIRVRWSELAPVGGISIVERFEVELFPLRLQLSHDIATKLINYLYPPQDSNAPATADTTVSSSLVSSRADLPTLGSRGRRNTLSSTHSANEPPPTSPISIEPPTPTSVNDGVLVSEPPMASPTPTDTPLTSSSSSKPLPNHYLSLPHMHHQKTASSSG
ncbi:Protein SABRE, partial [Linderina pennispora]